MSDEQNQSPPEHSKKKRRSIAGRMLRIAISNIGRNCITLVVGIVFTPLLIGLLGLPLFGIFIFITQFTNWLIAPIRSALTGAMILHLTRALTVHDEAALRRIFTAGLIVTVCGASLLVVLGVVLAIFSESLLQFDPVLATGVRIAVVCESLLIASRVGVSAYVNLQIASHRMVTYNVNESLQRVFDLVSLGIVLALNHLDVLSAGSAGSSQADPTRIFITFVLIRCALRFSHNLSRCVVARLAIPAARISLSEVTMEDVKEIAGTGAWSTADPFFRVCLFMVDNYLLNIFLGPVYNGLYALINQLRGYGRLLGGQLILGSEAVTTAVHETGEHRRREALLFANMRMVGGFVAISSVVIVGLFRPIVDVWLGSRLQHDPALLAVMTYDQAVSFARSFVLLLLLGGFVMETVFAGTKVLYGMGLIRKYSLPIVVTGLLKIVASYLVLRFTGQPLLLAWISLICEVLLFGLFIPRVIVRECEVSVGQLLFHAALRPLLAAAPVAVSCLVVRQFVTTWGILELAIAFAVAGATGAASVGLILMQRAERASAINLIGKRVGHVGRQGLGSGRN